MLDSAPRLQALISDGVVACFQRTAPTLETLVTLSGAPVKAIVP
jgi:hypothetical protein